MLFRPRVMVEAEVDCLLGVRPGHRLFSRGRNPHLFRILEVLIGI